MFFKRYLFIIFSFLLISCSLKYEQHTERGFFSEFSCFEDMGDYYQDFIKGTLGLKKQKRFFQCLHDSLELIVKHDIYTHDPSRDYFNREEIIRRFELEEYDRSTSAVIADKVLFIKKALIGGSIDKLKDQEIVSFYKLINDYQKIYSVLHKHIPIFIKAFTSDDPITPEEGKIALKALREAFKILEGAYSREGIVYRIDDLYKYNEYLMKTQIFGPTKPQFVTKGFWFLYNLFGGLFPSQEKIKTENWATALFALYKTINLFIHYKTYFFNKKASSEFIYKILESMEIFLSSIHPEKEDILSYFEDRKEAIKVIKRKGFPLKNLDEMLSVVLSLVNQGSSPSLKSVFGNMSIQSVPLFTRALNCFSLDRSPEKECRSEWGSGGSSPVVSLFFSDDKFEIFSNRIERSPISDKLVFMETDKLNMIRKWLRDYKKSFEDINEGHIDSVAQSRQFKHWLDSFFGWDKQSSRITFVAFDNTTDSRKFYQLLNYQAFLPLLFHSYFPEDFFSSDEVSVSFEVWEQIVREIVPVLAILKGQEEYKPSWRKSFYDLFNFADLFLYSSNRDNYLNSREFIDMIIHSLEGVKSSRFAYDRFSEVCGESLNASCAANEIVKDKDIMAAYPRLFEYFSSSFDDDQGENKYEEKIRAILKYEGESIQSLSFTPLFILLQIMELNYNLADVNQSQKLEFDEVFSLVQDFEGYFSRQIPYLVNEEQTRAYLMYSFKTGNIPFFTGNGADSVKFVNQHLYPENFKPFQVYPSDFYFVILDFYNIYQKN